MRRALFLIAAALAAIVASCFSPDQPACAFSCATTHTCPTSYVCAPDGFCHRADAQGLCTLTPDASSDSSSDASSDTSSD